MTQGQSVKEKNFELSLPHFQVCVCVFAFFSSICSLSIISQQFFPLPSHSVASNWVKLTFLLFPLLWSICSSTLVCSGNNNYSVCVCWGGLFCRFLLLDWLANSLLFLFLAWLVKYNTNIWCTERVYFSNSVRSIVSISPFFPFVSFPPPFSRLCIQHFLCGQSVVVVIYSLPGVLGSFKCVCPLNDRLTAALAAFLC